MKKIFVIFTSLLICWSHSQTVPEIDTRVVSPLRYSNQEVQEWERYLKIYWDSLENENFKLSSSDKKFKDMFEAKHKTYGDEYSELDTAPWETESPGCSWYCGAIYDTKVSSCLSPQGNNVYSKESLHDNDTRTAWVEGVPGYGIGESIEFIFPYYSARATTAFIANGYNKNETTWRNNSRVKTFTVYDENRLIGVVHLKDTRDLQSFELPYPFPNRPDNSENSYKVLDDKDQIVKPTRLRFVITDIYKGDKYEDTAISEFLFDGMDVHCIAEGSLVKMPDNSEKRIEEIKTGDFILTYNYEEDLFEPEMVTRIHSVTHHNLVKITFKTPTGFSEIIATEDHPFYTDKGWMSYNPAKTRQYSRYSGTAVKKYSKNSFFKFYSETKKGTEIISVSIYSIEYIQAPVKTYTIETNGENTFIVNNVMAGQE